MDIKKVNIKKFLKSAMKGFDKKNLNRLLCFFKDDAKEVFEKGRKSRESGQFIIVEKLVPSDFDEGKEQIIHFFIGYDPQAAEEFPLDESVKEQLAGFVENPDEWCESGGFGIDLLVFNPENFYPVNQEFWNYCKEVSTGM